MNWHLLITLMGLAQLALGIALGIWWATRHGAIIAHQDRWMRDLMAQFQQLASSIVLDVGEHRTKLKSTSDRLTAAGFDDAGREAAALTDIVSDIVDEVLQANGQLHQKLATAEEQIRQQSTQIESFLSEARSDGLTGLPNRRALDDELKRRFASWQRRGTITSVMLLDVDHFKLLNDRHGHLAGDAVLRKLGEVLTSTMREMDVVARFGGEEFAIVLPETDLAQGQVAAERARKAIEGARYRHGDKELAITVSVGLAELTAGDDVAHWLHRTDQALYASKHAGRNNSHLHNGKTCEPIGVMARETTSSTELDNLTLPPAETLPAEGELATACTGLRQRLVELVKKT